MYYIVTNEFNKEFAIVEEEIIQQIAQLINEYALQEIDYLPLAEDQNWDQLITEESIKGYRYVTIDEPSEAVEFTLA